MIEILFRGKRIDTGEWAYGQLWVNRTCTRETAHIFLDDGDMEEVEPSTVGQYTGINDRNGNRIFSGDVVTVDHYFAEANSRGNVEDGTLEVLYEYYGGINEIGEVKFERAAFVVQEWDLGIFEDHELEVIGNATDNPELLEC